MISQQDAEKSPNENIKNLLTNTQIIYNACLKEIIRQISIDCSERGQFIQKIWDAYLTLLERALIENQRQFASLDQKNIDENARIHKMYQREIEGLDEMIKTLIEDKEKLSISSNSGRDRIKNLKRELKLLKVENKAQQKENESIRKENEQVLKTNLELTVQIEELLYDKKGLERAMTYTPQKNPHLPRKLDSSTFSPRGNKEKIGLFTDNGASVVGHLMYLKTGEIIEPGIKLEDLQKFKEKFPLERLKSFQSVYSPKRKIEKNNFDALIIDLKNVEIAKDDVAEDSNSEISMNFCKEDKNVGTENAEFYEKGVNTSRNESFEGNNEEIVRGVEAKDIAELIEEVIKEVQLAEKERNELKEKILNIITKKLGNSGGLNRKITIFEQENIDLKKKYRDLVIQCNEFELENNDLNDQLQTNQKKLEEAFDFWGSEQEETLKKEDIGNFEENLQENLKEKEDLGRIPKNQRMTKRIFEKFMMGFLDFNEANNEDLIEEEVIEEETNEEKSEENHEKVMKTMNITINSLGNERKSMEEVEFKEKIGINRRRSLEVKREKIMVERRKQSNDIYERKKPEKNSLEVKNRKKSDKITEKIGRKEKFVRNAEKKNSDKTNERNKEKNNQRNIEKNGKNAERNSYINLGKIEKTKEKNERQKRNSERSHFIKKERTNEQIDKKNGRNSEGNEKNIERNYERNTERNNDRINERNNSQNYERNNDKNDRNYERSLEKKTFPDEKNENIHNAIDQFSTKSKKIFFPTL